MKILSMTFLLDIHAIIYYNINMIMIYTVRKTTIPSLKLLRYFSSFVVEYSNEVFKYDIASWFCPYRLLYDFDIYTIAAQLSPKQKFILHFSCLVVEYSNEVLKNEIASLNCFYWLLYTLEVIYTVLK